MATIQKIGFTGDDTNLLKKSLNATTNVTPPLAPRTASQQGSADVKYSDKKAQKIAYISSALAIVSLGVAGATVVVNRRKSSDVLQKSQKYVSELVNPLLEKAEKNIGKKINYAIKEISDVSTNVSLKLSKVSSEIDSKAKWFDGVNNDVYKRINNIENKISNIAVKSGHDGNSFLARNVEVNGLQMTLAKVEHEITGEAEAKLVADLRQESAKRILGLINRDTPIPQNPVFRVVTAEVRPFSNTGGMSVVPKELVTNLVAMIGKKQDARIIIDTPAYTGQVSKGNWMSIEKNADGKTYSYISTTKDTHGQPKKEVIAKLEKIDKLNLNIFTDESKVLEKVNIYLTEPKSETVDFNLLKPRLDVDLRHAIADGLKKQDKFENEVLSISKNKKTQQIEANVKIRYVLYENDNFNLDAPINVDGNIYRHDTTNGITEPERFAKFSKFFTEHMYNSAKSTNNWGADVIVTNDWSTGFIAPIMRQLTAVKKAYGMNPVVADHYQNIPIVHLLHNAKESGWEWQKQSKIFNIIFGEHAAKIVENSHMVNAFVQGKSNGMNGRILNALMEEKSVNPQIMAASYSDFVIPVSDGYAKNVATTGVYGYSAHDIYRLRAREWEFGDIELLKHIAYQNGISPNNFDLSKPTLIGITNGCDKANNILTADKANALVKDLYLGDEVRFKILRQGDDALSVHNFNKKIALDKVKHDVEVARSGKGNTMNIALPEMTDLSGVTENTPVFSTAGRIVDQKGLDIFAESIKEFYKNFKGTDYPVFYAQGVGNLDYIKKFLDVKREIAKINPEAANRIVFAKLFTEPGRYDCCKLMSDFTIMSSWFEPCGLVHKEIASYSGAIPIVTDTGGLKSGLQEGLNVIISKFKPKEGNNIPLEENGRYFSQALHKAYQLFNNKVEFAKGIEASYRVDHSWLRKDGAIDKYAKVFVDLKVLNPEVMTYAKHGKLLNLYDNSESTYKVVNRRIGTNPPTEQERLTGSWIKHLT